jgi:hypothetical protein
MPLLKPAQAIRNLSPTPFFYKSSVWFGFVFCLLWRRKMEWKEGECAFVYGNGQKLPFFIVQAVPVSISTHVDVIS